jgi:hypothetical protein
MPARMFHSNVLILVLVCSVRYTLGSGRVQEASLGKWTLDAQFSVYWLKELPHQSTTGNVNCSVHQYTSVWSAVYTHYTIRHDFDYTNTLHFPDFRQALGPTQPPIQWVPGALSLGVKRPGSETDHSPLSSSDVKNACNYTSTTPIRLHGVVLS